VFLRKQGESILCVAKGTETKLGKDCERVGSMEEELR
jgi:hypothetical protein